MARYPLAPRILAGAGALAVLVFFGLDLPLGLIKDGKPWSAYALAACTVPLILFLGLLAAAPDALQRILSRISRVDLKDSGHVAAVVVMAGTLFFVLGYGAVFSGVYAYEIAYPHGEAPLEKGAYPAPLLNATWRNGSVNLSWTSVPDAAGYRIYRGGANGSARVFMDVGSTNATNDASAAPATVWHYRVAAIGPLGTGAASDEQVVAIPLDASELFQSLTLNVILLVLPVVLYVSFVHGYGPIGALRAIGLGGPGIRRAFALGIGAAIGFLVVLSVVGWAVGRANGQLGDNERALGLADSLASLGSMAWFGALAVAALSAFSEEVFFRGFLQSRVGMLGQAALFAAAHVNYVSLVEIAVVFALAFVLGGLLRFTRSLWAPIGAHFAFNMIMLLIAIYGGQFAS